MSVHDTVPLVSNDMVPLYICSKIFSDETVTGSCSSVDRQICRVPKAEGVS